MTESENGAKPKSVRQSMKDDQFSSNSRLSTTTARHHKYHCDKACDWQRLYLHDKDSGCQPVKCLGADCQTCKDGKCPMDSKCNLTF